MERDVIRCGRCILPETFPGVRLDAEGVCNFCRKARREEVTAAQQRKYEAKFRKLVGEHRGREGYDVIMAYSGGKDSTYTLDVLVRRYRLRVLALTFDNGFLSPRAEENIRAVCRRLGVDHYMVRPDEAMLHRIFATGAVRELFPPKTLERASTICTACIGIIKHLVLRTAIEKRIPFVGFGWSPGQAPVSSSVMKVNPAFVASTQEIVLRPLLEICGDAVRAFFLAERHFADKSAFPWNVHPLAFLPYDEAQIHAHIQELGWRAPEDTDPNSSNCLLNAFANHVHRRRYRFHPYVWEMANMVRQGVLPREEALAKIEPEEDRESVARVEAILAGKAA